MPQVLLTGMMVGHSPRPTQTASPAGDLPDYLPVGTCTQAGLSATFVCLYNIWHANIYKYNLFTCYLIKPLLLKIPYNSITEKLHNKT